ncbi:cupin domain-containing protein [Yinghuangia sp. YIM S09857]|uniref:cupin domain-containing protein n=1 Tax=Yinghuangia sp. YIM S09857 TaxID=3436929 RepID=UPI003F53C593
MSSGDRRYMLKPGEGIGGERTFFGRPLRMLATGRQTGDEFTLSERRADRAFRTPWHVHHIEDEAFYVLSGALEVACGDARWRAEAGAFVFLPHSVPHAFRVVSDEAATLHLTQPSGFEEFAAEMADAELSDAGLPAVAEAAHRAGYEVLGPSPFPDD